VADPTTAAAIRDAMSRYGLTQKQVGTLLGVSDRMVRQVLSGNKPGKNLQGAASQLAREGRVAAPPARREQRVRAKGGGTEPVGPPVDVRRSVEPGARAQTVIDFPPRGLGRVAAGQAVLDDLDAHRGASRVTVRVVTRYHAPGYTLGGRKGYVVRTMRRRIQDDGDDALDWIADEVNSLPNCTAAGSVSTGNIIRITLTYFV
jgi:hypothetical protein